MPYKDEKELSDVERDIRRAIRKKERRYFDIRSSKSRIFATLQLIEGAKENLFILISCDDEEEEKVICNPRIIRALKMANAAGVKIVLILPLFVNDKISHLIPEFEPLVDDLPGLSFTTMDNNTMGKVSFRNEAKAIFAFYKDSVIPLLAYDFLKENQLLSEEGGTESGPLH